MGSLAGTKRVAGLGAALVLGAVLAGCGGGSGASSDDPASVLPADADYYVESVLVPEGDQAEAIEAIAARFPGGEDLGAMIAASANEDLSEDGSDLDFEEDIVPVLGERVAIAGQIGDGDPVAAAVQLADPEQAEEIFVELTEADGSDFSSGEYGGVDYRFTDDEGDSLDASAFVGDYLLAASTPEDLEAVIDVANGDADSLADSDSELVDASEDAGEDGELASGAVDLSGVIEAEAAAEGIEADQISAIVEDFYGVTLDDPITFSVGADADRATFDVSYAVTGEAAFGLVPTSGDLLEVAPSDSLAAYGIADLGGGYAELLRAFQDPDSPLTEASGLSPEEIQSQIDEELGFDILPALDAIGDTVIFVNGDSLENLGGAAIAEVEDEGAVTPIIDAARTGAAQDPDITSIGPLPSGLPAGSQGFSFTSAELGVPLNLVLGNGRLVLGYGDESTRLALEGSETGGPGRLEDARGALGEEFEPSFVADGPAILELIAATPLASQLEFTVAQPYLEPFDLLAAGATLEDDRATSRFVITFR